MFSILSLALHVIHFHLVTQIGLCILSSLSYIQILSNLLTQETYIYVVTYHRYEKKQKQLRPY